LPKKSPDVRQIKSIASYPPVEKVSFFLDFLLQKLSAAPVYVITNTFKNKLHYKYFEPSDD